LKDLFKFVLAEKNIDGTVIEKRIKETISKGKNYLYKPRSAGQGFHKHANKISEEKMSELMTKLEYYLHFFGYAKDDRPEHADEICHTDSQGHEYPKHSFYDYKGQASEKSKNSYMDFLKLNENMLKMRLHEKETGKYSSIPINKGNDGFSMLTKKAVTAYVDLLENTHIR